MTELHVSLNSLLVCLSKTVIIMPVAARGLMLSRAHEQKPEHSIFSHVATWIQLFYSGTPTLFGSYVIVNKTVSSITLILHSYVSLFNKMSKCLMGYLCWLRPISCSHLTLQLEIWWRQGYIFNSIHTHSERLGQKTDDSLPNTAMFEL